MRPLAQLATRVGLWAAIGVGCVGGVLGLLRPSGGEPELVAAAPDNTSLPAPVAGVAEMAIEAWLAPTAERDEARLDVLFVQPPELAADRGVDVGWLTTVSGYQIEVGYWSVTVAVQVTECVATVPTPTQSPEGANEPSGPPCDPTADEAGADGVPSTQATETTLTDTAATGHLQTSIWYLEAGIVGDDARGLAALTTPAVVPAPTAVSEDWAPSASGLARPSPEDPAAETIQGFLGSLLAGGGDPARYLAPGLDATALEPAPFTALELTGIAVTELEDGTLRTRALVDVTTPGGAHQPLAYEVVLGGREDRWEVLEYWGAPTLGSRPEVGSG